MAAPPPNPLDTVIMTFPGNGFALTAATALNFVRPAGGRIALETFVSGGCTSAFLLGVNSPANPFAPANPSPAIAGAPGLPNKAVLVADVVTKILNLLVTWNVAWVPGFDPNAAPAAGGGGAGAGGGLDNQGLAAILRDAVTRPPVPAALRVGGEAPDSVLASFVGQPQNDPARQGTNLATMIKAGTPFQDTLATRGFPFTVGGVDRVGAMLNPFTTALGIVAGRNSSFVNKGPDNEDLLLGFKQGVNTIYIGASASASPLTAGDVMQFLVVWSDLVREGAEGLRALGTDKERETALQAWNVIHGRLVTMATYLAQLYHEPTLALAVMVVLTGDMMTRGTIVLLSGHALDWDSVFGRYRDMARRLELTATRYAIKAAEAAKRAADLATAAAVQAQGQAQLAQQGAKRRLDDRRLDERRLEGGGRGGGRGGGNDRGNDRFDRGNDRARPRMSGTPTCALEPHKVWTVDGQCPLEGHTHAYKDCKNSDYRTGVVRGPDYGWFRNENTFLPRAGHSYVSEPRNSKVPESVILKHSE